MKIKAFTYTCLMAAVGSALLSSCAKKTDIINPGTTTTTTTTTTATTGAVTDLEVNKWILDNMRLYYYWNDKIPANPNMNQTPDNFFDSILNKYNATTNPNGDRFSWIQESADELKASLGGESTTTGMEFNLYLRAQGSTDVIAQVVYVLPGSPAALAGIKRGDVFYKVNGTALSTTNYGDLIYGDGNTKTYTFGTITSSGLTNSENTKTVTAVVFQEDPVFKDSIYTIGANKIGYLVYNQFNPGVYNNTTQKTDQTYDDKLRTIFGKFKAQGVNQMILDFRYNPGGYVSSAVLFGSLLAKGVGTKSVFVKKDYNATLTPLLQKEYGNDFFYDYLNQEANNIGGNLSQVYVLTTNHSASASELVINCLRPYMNQAVYNIGTTTYGKNVGSITITDDTKRIKWGMQPIVTKSFNKDNQSDYSTGFVPKVEVREPLNLKPLGDITEPLLSEAIFQITGTRLARRPAQTDLPAATLGSSVDRKAGGRNMFFQMQLLPTVK